jgi:hypothetical protein
MMHKSGIYMYIDCVYGWYIHVYHNQYTCIYHPYTQSIYMYIHVYTTLMHHQYTSIYQPYTQSIYRVVYTCILIVYMGGIYRYIDCVYGLYIHVYYLCIRVVYTCILIVYMGGICMCDQVY